MTRYKWIRLRGLIWGLLIVYPHIAASSASEAKPTETVTGAIRLPSGVDVGQRDIAYSVTRDEQGRITRLDDAQGDGFLIEYRRVDEIPGLDVWRKDGTSTHYDAKGRPVEITLDSDATIHHTYDSDGQLTETVDAFGGKTRYSYDQAKRQVTTTLPDGATLTEMQDARGRCIESTCPGGNKTVTRYLLLRARGQTL
jgi:YD repeat-containing protein